MKEGYKYFFGYASIFNERDLNGDVILPQSFDESFLLPNKVFLFYEHDSKQNIGKLLKLRQNSKGLYIEGLVHNAFVKQKMFYLSIGYIPIYKHKSSCGIRYISKIKLFEVSVVKKPANKKAIAFCI